MCDSVEMWRFDTARFSVIWFVSPSEYPDLSWCDQETLDNLESGFWVCFDSEVRVELDGLEISADYLGESIYENISDFRKDSGYFYDMVKSAVSEARKVLKNRPQLRQGAIA